MLYYQGESEADPARISNELSRPARRIGKNMSDNKVVIKINYDKKSTPIGSAPKTVTVWHTRRILGAILTLAILSAILVSWLSGNGEETAISTALNEKVQQTNNSTDTSVAGQPQVPLQVTPSSSTPNAISAESSAVKNQSAPSRPAAIIYSRKVIRASMNASIKDNEPGEVAKFPLNIGPNQPVELFYFTEIRNFPDKVLFHQWLRNGQVVHQKQLDIKGSRTKVWSNKVFSVKDKGEWQVRLSDKKSKVYSEANFLINAD